MLCVRDAETGATRSDSCTWQSPDSKRGVFDSASLCQNVVAVTLAFKYVDAIVRGFNLSPVNRNLWWSLNSLSYWLCGLKCVSLPLRASLFSSMIWG